MKLCAIDNGYQATKVKTEDKKYRFYSRIQKTQGEFKEKNTIKFEGESYTVGTGKDDLMMNKTEGIVPKLCALRALAENTDQEEHFNLVVDLPIIHYFNQDTRDEFKDYIGKSEKIEHNGKIKQIHIDKCTVVPQGLAALYAGNISQFKDKMIAILDIGGLTVDGCVIENLKPIKESMFTTNLGTKILEDRVRTALNTKFTLNIQDYEIPYLMRTGIKGSEEPSTCVIEDTINEYFEDLIREMTRKNWSVATLPIYGIGGGLLLLKEKMSFHFGEVEVADDPAFANVNGLYRIGSATA